MCETLATNAEGAGGPPNPLRRDPTRTTTLRAKCVADMRRRFRAARSAVFDKVAVEDAFATGPATNAREFEFLSNPDKLTEFMRWLKEQVDAEILVVDAGFEDTPWLAEYVTPAYRAGVARGYTEVNKAAAADNFDTYQGGRAAFLASAFGGPEVVSKVRLLYMRAFEELRGVTATMAQQLTAILADGLAAGRHGTVIAREMVRKIDGLTNTRATMIARTEIIRAHAEGQLDSFVKLGVEELGLMAEWVYGGGACPLCVGMAESGPYTIEEARGLIPLHPNCRCTWVPYVRTGNERKIGKLRA